MKRLILFITLVFLFLSGFSNNGVDRKIKKYKEGELLVKFKKDISFSKASYIHREAKGKVKKSFQELNIHHIKLPDDITVEEAISFYKNNPEVEYAEPNYIFRKAKTPNDTFFNQQWHHQKIKSEEAWDNTTGKGNIVIAVLDTGIDYNHPDLKDNMWKDSNGFYGYDFAYNDNDPMDDDIEGKGSHGTHVAGVIGAVGNNNLGVTGINWSVKLMAIKVLDNKGSGYVSDIIEGIEYAISKGAKVINLSLEAPEGTSNISSLRDAILNAKNYNVLVVSAAGNNRSNLNNINIYPASFKLENLISVAAVDQYDSLGSYSNYGTNVVHLAASGSNIYSTQSFKAPGFRGYSSAYFYETGTSMAAPMVSGVAGLLLSNYSSISYKGIKERILLSVDKINGLPVFSGGRLNAFQALTISLNSLPPLKPENFSLKEPLVANQPINLKWFDLSSTEWGYKLQRNLKNGGFENLAILSSDTTEYRDNISLQEGDRVSYKLFAYNGNGESEALELNLQLPLNRPTNLITTMVENGIKLTWEDNTINEDGYEIWRQDGLNSFKKLTTVGKDVTIFIDNNLTSASFYYYKVRAFNNLGIYSDFSNESFIKVEQKSSSTVKYCFIATATYGTPYHPHIDVLRNFRDKYLLNNSLGRKFVSSYYRHSPAIADVIRESIILRAFCLILIVPIVYLIKFPLTLIILVSAIILLSKRNFLRKLLGS